VSIPKEVYYSLLYLSLFLLIIRRNKLESQHLWLIPLLVAALATEYIHDIAYPAPISKSIYHIYQFLEGLFLSLFYYSSSYTKRNKTIIKIGFSFYALFMMIEFFFDKNNFISTSGLDVSVGGFLITVYSILYLFELYQKDEDFELTRMSHFWVVSGNLIFYSITLVYYIFQQYLSKNSPHYQELAMISMISNLILYLFYSIGFLCPTQTKK
jgi:peptidoglycan/LPS O-acetylase OafA/YrhL